MSNFLSSVSTRQWTFWGMFNLVIVAAFGLLMRTSIVLPQTWFNQKYIMHAHSHFAFSGWISHMLMTLMIMAVLNKKPHEGFPLRYQLLLGANMLASYGMLFFFSWQGYGRYSIICSTLTILLSYFFVGMMWRSITKTTLSPLVRKWFRTALIFLFISSIGTFYLAYLQATHNLDGNKQLSAIYFFLHFQYNGWFFFTCMGLINHWLVSRKVSVGGANMLYNVFAWGCIPAYLLSVLWIDLPIWLYVILVFVVVCQNLSWIYWLIGLFKHFRQIKETLVPWLRKMLLCVLLATSIKLLLQFIAVIPAFSSLTYSFRPIVIGYLHLVLLGIITLFILAFVFMNDILTAVRMSKWAIALFILGVVVNEMLLLLQGVSGMQGTYIPYIPFGLMLAACLLFLSLLLLWSFTLRLREQKRDRR